MYKLVSAIEIETNFAKRQSIFDLAGLAPNKGLKKILSLEKF